MAAPHLPAPSEDSKPPSSPRLPRRSIRIISLLLLLSGIAARILSERYSEVTTADYEVKPEPLPERIPEPGPDPYRTRSRSAPIEIIYQERPEPPPGPAPEPVAPPPPPRVDALQESGRPISWRLLAPLDFRNDRTEGLEASMFHTSRPFVPITSMPPTLRIDAQATGDPPLLKPWQSGRIVLPGMPSANYQLVVTLARVHLLEKPPLWPWNVRPTATSPADCSARRGEFLYLSINGKRVYGRWRVGTELMVRAFVPSTMIDPDSNVLVIDNAASTALALDTCWIEPAAPDGPVRVALVDGDWLTNPQVTASVMALGVRLPVPYITVPDRPAAAALTAGKLVDRRRAWAIRQADPWRDDRDRWERTWAAKLDAVLARDAEPLANIYFDEEDMEGLRCVLHCFGPYVRFWILNPPTQAAGTEAEALIRSVIEDARIITHDGQSVQNPAWQYGTDAYNGRRKELLFSRSMLADLGAGGAETLFRDRWLEYTPTAADYGPRALSTELPDAVFSWLDSGGSGVWLEGGRPAELIFPQGDVRLRPTWSAVRLVTCMGEEDARRIPASLLPTSAAAGLTAARFVAVQHSGPRVTVGCYGGPDAGRPCLLWVPVPWRTPQTHYAIQSVSLDRNTELPLAEPVNRGTTETLGLDSGGAYVRLRLTLPHLAVIRFWQPGEAPTIHNPTVTGGTGLGPPFAFMDDLFSVVPTEAGEIPPGAWVTDLFYPLDPGWAIGRDDAVTGLVPATPGTVGRHADVVPRADTSVVVELTQPQRPVTEADGARVSLSTGPRETPAVLQLWVRATSPDGEEKALSFLLGSKSTVGRVTLPAGVWTQLTAPWERLFGRASDSDLWVYSDGAAEAGTPPSRCRLEINAAFCFGPQGPDRTTVATDVILRALPPDPEADGPARKIILLRPAGQAFYGEIRFPRPLLRHAGGGKAGDVRWSYASMARLLTVRAPATKAPAGEYPAAWSQCLTDQEKALCRTGKAVLSLVTVEPNQAGSARPRNQIGGQ